MASQGGKLFESSGWFVGAQHLHSVPSGHLTPCPGERKSVAATQALIQSGFLSPGQGERWPEGTEWGWLAMTAAIQAHSNIASHALVPGSPVALDQRDGRTWHESM